MIGLIVMALIVIPLMTFVFIGLFGSAEVRKSRVPLHFFTAFFLISFLIVVGMFAFAEATRFIVPP